MIVDGFSSKNWGFWWKFPFLVKKFIILCQVLWKNFSFWVDFSVQIFILSSPWLNTNLVIDIFYNSCKKSHSFSPPLSHDWLPDYLQKLKLFLSEREGVHLWTREKSCWTMLRNSEKSRVEVLNFDLERCLISLENFLNLFHQITRNVEEISWNIEKLLRFFYANFCKNSIIFPTIS